MPEISDGDAASRLKRDFEEVKDVLQTIGLPNFPIKAVSRIGKIQSGRSRLLRLTLHDEDSKAEVLRRARILRTSNRHKRVFLNPDRTPFEQSLFASMRQEMQERRGRGEDVVIYDGKVTERKQISGRPNFPQ